MKIKEERIRWANGYLDKQFDCFSSMGHSGHPMEGPASIQALMSSCGVAHPKHCGYLTT